MSDPQPVIIRDQHYPSLTAAAQALSLTPTAVARARKRGELDTLGLNYRRPARIRHKTTIYPSISAACRAKGRSRIWVIRRASLQIQGWSFA